MEKLFKLKQNGTNVRTEIVAGLTTFFTMAYIIFVNPQILGTAIIGDDGQPLSAAILLATCVAAAIGTLLIGLLSNYPLAQAPGMGLNAFFAFTICGQFGYSWRAALAAVFISGILFILLTVTGARGAIVKAIPMPLKKAISAGIGLFIALVGLTNAGLLSKSEGGMPIMGLGDLTVPTTLLAVVGLVIVTALVVRKVKGGLFIGIIATSILGAICQFGFGVDMGILLPSADSFSTSFSMETFGQFIPGFAELFNLNEGLGAAILSIVTVLISLTLVDMFDTIGTLIGTADKAGFLDKDGNLPNMNKALMADAVATSVGAVLGTSTVTTYVESSAGVSEGGRTGLTSVTTAIMFLLAIFLSPVLGVIPGAATAPVLIIVGVMMAGGLKDIDWTDIDIAIPAFFTVVLMPFCYSIAEGIGVGFIFYTIIKMVRGKFKEVHPVMYAFAAIFIVRFILLAL